MNFTRIFAKEINALISHLRDNGISENVIEKMIKSGYIYNGEIIVDTYYGSNFMYQPVITLEILKYLHNKGLGHNFPSHERIYKVNNIEELYNVVNKIKSKHNNLVFRGATNSYMFKREFPNPFYSNKDGFEISLIPSFYRKYLVNHMEMIEFDDIYNPAFDKEIFHDLYYGEFEELIKSVDNRNISIEEFFEKADIFREKCWENNISNIDAATIYQHYGFDSNVLDVTYNIDISLFFAFNKFVKIRDNYYDYIPLETKEYINAVVYILCPKTDLDDIYKWKYNTLSVNNLECVRPLRQECTSLPANIDNINIATSEIKAIINFTEDFKLPDTMPKKEYLFPSEKEDAFYAYLLNNEKLKEKTMKFVFNI